MEMELKYNQAYIARKLPGVIGDAITHTMGLIMQLIGIDGSLWTQVWTETLFFALLNVPGAIDSPSDKIGELGVSLILNFAGADGER